MVIILGQSVDGQRIGPKLIGLSDSTYQEVLYLHRYSRWLRERKVVYATETVTSNRIGVRSPVKAQEIVVRGDMCVIGFRDTDVDLHRLLCAHRLAGGRLFENGRGPV